MAEEGKARRPARHPARRRCAEEDEEAAAPDPRRAGAEGGPSVVTNGGLYNATEVSS